MKKRILSILLTLCMVICLVPVSVLADDTALRSVAIQNIGPNEAAVENDLYEKMSVQVSVIKLISDIELGGCLSIDYEVTIDLDGHVLKIADDSNDRVIKITKNGHLILTDGRSTAEHKFTPNADGLWVLDEAGGTEIVKGGIITGGNTSGDDDGGVLIEPGGRFTMNGGSIVGCQARRQYSGSGGGVKVDCETDPDSGIISNGTFTMNGGAIIGCVARHGGGVETNGGGEGENGTFTMNGGVIDSCVAADGMGGGVQNDGLFIMGKDATIKNCKAVEYGQYYHGGGVSFSGDRQILNGEIVSGDANDKDYIYVNRGTVTIGANAKIQANIFCSNGTMALADGVTSATVYGKITNGRFADGVVAVTYQVNGADYATQILKSGSAAIRPADPTVPTGRTFDGWYKTDGTKWDFSTAVTEDTTLAGWLYKGVSTADEFTAAMNDNSIDVIRLTDNITLSGSKAIDVTNGRQVILDLNGYVLDLAGTYISVSAVNATARALNQLTIMDSDPAAEHKFRDDGTGLWVLDTNGDKLVKGGIITGGKATYYGGAIDVGFHSKVIMNSGNIVGCSNSGSGGAVSIANNATFEMNGGSIRGCKATYCGGAVCVGSRSSLLGTFTMTGGSITDCKAANGSGVYLYATMNANGGTVDGTVELASTTNNVGTTLGTIQGSGSTATQFNGDVTNYGEIKRGTYNGTVTLGNSTLSGKITGGIFNGPVTTDSEGEAAIGGGVFNKTVTINRGEITKGTFNKDVVVYNVQPSFSCTTLIGGTYNGLIINKSAYAAFVGAHSLLGIVETKPSSQYSNDRYRTVTFDPAGGTMDYPVRYFLDDGNISDQIVPDSRAGYFFAGWYKADGTAWNYNDTVGEDDLTLTAHWTVCDHSGHTGAQPDCTTSVICTECGGTIAALGHNFSVEQHNNDEHWKKCSRCDTIDDKEPHDWNSGTITKPATCTTSGEKTYTCTDCGFEKIESIQAKGHSWGQEWQHDATHHWHSCSNCDEKLQYLRKNNL